MANTQENKEDMSLLRMPHEENALWNVGLYDPNLESNNPPTYCLQGLTFEKETKECLREVITSI
jgi:hypothetical protein